MRRLITGLMVASAAGAAAQSGPVRVELLGTQESLSGGNLDWRTLQLSVSRQLGPRRSLYGVGRLTERFGKTDQQLTLGAYVPVRPKLTSLVELSYSPTAEVLPRIAGTAQLQWEVGKGYVVNGGLTRTEFRTDSSTGFIVGLERYWRDYRFAYFFSGGTAREAGFAAGHRVSATRYLDDRTSYGLGLGLGQEVEAVAPGTVLRTDVLALTLNGRLGVGRRGSVYAELGYFRQGDLYVRRALTLGYRHEF